jgi:hypothetical protein
MTWKRLKETVDAKLRELGKDDTVTIDYIDIDGWDLRGGVTLTIEIDAADQIAVH